MANLLSKICKCGSDLLPRLVFKYEYVGFTPASDEERVKKCKFSAVDGIAHITNTESFIFCIDGKKYNLKYCKSKSIYSALIQSKAETWRGFKKLVSDFSIDSETVQKAFLLANRNASESFLKSSQYKILDDITFTNSRLAKIGYFPCDLCTFCNASPETRDHLFYLCKYAKEFGNNLKNFGCQ